MTAANYFEDGHLGGYLPVSPENPHGDPATYFPELWQWMINTLGVKSVLDVGCGEGHALKWFLNHGVDAIGYEGCMEAIRNSPVAERIFCLDFTDRQAALPDFWPPRDSVSFDLVLATEFVEHVEEQFIPNYLPAFQLGKVLAMTHAFPGQEGYHHVHLREGGYWIDLMEANGFRFNPQLTVESRKLDPAGHWRRSGLIFHRV